MPTTDELLTEFSNLVNYLVDNFDLNFTDPNEFLDFLDVVWEELFIPLVEQQFGIGSGSGSTSSGTGSTNPWHRHHHWR